MPRMGCHQPYGRAPLIGSCAAMRIERIGNIYGEWFGTGYAGNIWDKNGISPSLMTMAGGGREPMIVEAYED